MRGPIQHLWRWGQRPHAPTLGAAQPRRRRRLVRLGIGSVLAAAMATGAGVVAPQLTGAASAATWSQPVAVDSGGTQLVQAVSCVSASQCTAVDESGQEITFDPQTGQGGTPVVIDANTVLTAVDCATASQCVATDSSGNAIAFDPALPGQAMSIAIDPGGLPMAIACTWTTQCTAVDVSGNEITFNPTTGSLQAPEMLTPLLQVLSSPTSGGGALTGTASGGTLSGPSGGTLTGNAGTLTPTASGAAGGSGTISAVPATGLPFAGLACPSDDLCVAVDSLGDEVTFDPNHPADASGATIDAPSGAAQALSGVSCPTTTQCTAVDINGDVVSFDPATPTLDPTNPTAGSPPLPVQIDSQTAAPSFTSISCPISTQCSAVDQGGFAYTFDPATPATAVGALLNGGASFMSVSCPTATQCTTVDEIGEEATFDPTNPANVSGGAMDAGTSLNGVSCPATTQCTAVDALGNAVTISFANDVPTPGTPVPIALVPGESLAGVACPTTGQCTAIDPLGDAITFDPSPAAVENTNEVDPNGVPSAIACPSASQCTVVDTSGQAITFDPSPYSLINTTSVDPGTGGVPNGLTGLSCPLTSQCTAVDDAGQEVTFDPTSGTVDTTAPVDTAALSAVSCPDAGTCTAVDGAGQAVSFTPTNPGTPTPVGVDSAQLDAVTCRPDLCVAVDAAGHAVQGNPWQLGSWSGDEVPGAGVLNAATFLDADHVVALDGTGNLFTGEVPPPPQPPVITSPSKSTPIWPPTTPNIPASTGSPSLLPVPAGVPLSALGTASTVTVSSSSQMTTLRLGIDGTSAVLTVPAGALPTGTTIALAPVKSAGDLGHALPASDAYIVSFSVAWRAPDGSTPSASAPITLTITDPVIHAGDVVYELTPNGLRGVGRAIVNGTVTLTFTGDPAFVVASVPQLKLPVATATVRGTDVALRLSCTHGTRCAGIARLEVVRNKRVSGHLVSRPLVLAAGRFSVAAPGTRNVKLHLGGRGAFLFDRHASRPLGVTLVVELDGGRRIVERVMVRG